MTEPPATSHISLATWRNTIIYTFIFPGRPDATPQHKLRTTQKKQLQHQQHLLDEAEVVADKNASSVKLVDGAGEAVDCLKVQVIGGLVQQQQMRLLCSDPRECDLFGCEMEGAAR